MSSNVRETKSGGGVRRRRKRIQKIKTLSPKPLNPKHPHEALPYLH
jgi:hypothetical protein